MSVGRGPSIEQLVLMISEGDWLQIVPTGDWQFEDSTVVLDVRPGKTRVPYWRAALRDDAGTANHDDGVRFVAARLRDVIIAGFPPPDFTDRGGGWYRISMTTDGQVGDYMLDDGE